MFLENIWRNWTKNNSKMNNKLLKILLNIIVVILCVWLLYFISVFSIFTFLGRRIGDNVDSQYIIVAIIIIALCILLLGIIVKCILMIMKILKSQWKHIPNIIIKPNQPSKTQNKNKNTKSSEWNLRIFFIR